MRWYTCVCDGQGRTEADAVLATAHSDDLGAAVCDDLVGNVAAADILEGGAVNVEDGATVQRDGPAVIVGQADAACGHQDAVLAGDLNVLRARVGHLDKLELWVVHHVLARLQKVGVAVHKAQPNLAWPDCRFSQTR